MTIWLNTVEAAERIRRRPRTMTGWRMRGVGPPYFRIEGVVLYRPADLDAWLESCRCTPERESEQPDAA